ncbi:SDR family NAD(P)-dependent oxidoreductase [Clostridium cellulovorans]|uniref:Short-chain dehydrogenase/reductase SDR n=1 Tax=Clostridium cellulovorans (strain ATCC 35296 / DSM 3052 / OCM 3 / 743B) TaxID=573061 RepID=D9SRZ1_CLOC7|nr:SDR family oxidoreductase [Clostridium cellulovorans]ADL50508.1 short-chain dehydrogenase/reductase SDR [Clostridium cellulovorans 743B]
MKKNKMLNSDGYTLITGATSGIGYELSKVFAEEGFNILLQGRNEEKLIKVKEELLNLYNSDAEVTAIGSKAKKRKLSNNKEASKNDFINKEVIRNNNAKEKNIESSKIKVDYIVADLINDKDVNRIFEYVDNNKFIVDNFINNAGIGSYGYFHQVPIATDLELIEVNINAFTKMLKIFVPYMIKQGHGRILNVASTAAFTAGPKMSVYYASKAYVLSLSEALREELKENNIVVSTLCPGPTATAFQAKAKIKKSSTAKGAIVSADMVARFAFKEMMKGKSIIIPGFKNKALIKINSMMPRRLVHKVIHKTNQG